MVLQGAAESLNAMYCTELQRPGSTENAGDGHTTTGGTREHAVVLGTDKGDTAPLHPFVSDQQLAMLSGTSR